jgi:hypothetical protein
MLNAQRRSACKQLHWRIWKQGIFRRHDYGEHNEGVLELQIGQAYHFIFTDADGFTEPDMNLATLDDNGKTFLCLNDACTEEDKQKLGCFPGGGMGG